MQATVPQCAIDDAMSCICAATKTQQTMSLPRRSQYMKASFLQKAEFRASSESHDDLAHSSHRFFISFQGANASCFIRASI